MSKFGDKVKKFFKKDTTKKALRKFGDSMQQSAQDIASSIDTTTMAKGVTVAVNENDLRPPPSPPGSNPGDIYATHDPYTEWSTSKKKDKEINIDLTI